MQHTPSDWQEMVTLPASKYHKINKIKSKLNKQNKWDLIEHQVNSNRCVHLTTRDDVPGVFYGSAATSTPPGYHLWCCWPLWRSAVTADRNAVDRPAVDSVAGKRVTAVAQMSSAAGSTGGFCMRWSYRKQHQLTVSVRRELYPG
jgi:hypothetical protein